MRRGQWLLWAATVLVIYASNAFVSPVRHLLQKPAPLELRFPAPALPDQFDQLSARRKSAKRRRIPLPDKAITPHTDAPADPNDARMQIQIEHHFQAAKATVWVDDAVVFEQALRGASARHPIFRTVEMNQVSNLDLKPGKHLLQVRVVSYPAEFDQVETIDVELAPASQKVLLINCDNRKKMDISLQ